MLCSISKMESLKTLLLFVVLSNGLISFSLAFNFTYEDLKQINGSCYSKGGCLGEKAALNQTSVVNCFCDEVCIKYGDCCLQARAYNQTKMVEAYDRYQCINVNMFRSYYMISKCKAGWTLKTAEELCLNATSGSRPHAFHDPFVDIPVTRLSTNTTYRNYYCAVCNDDHLDDLLTWDTKVVCANVVNISQSYIREHLQYGNGVWGININDTKGVIKFHSCNILPELPVALLPKIRRCEKYMSKCSINWTDPATEQLCQSYTNIVYDLHNRHAYRNYHCAKCNFIDAKNLDCKREIVLYHQKPVSLSVLFDFGQKVTACPKGNVYDPHSKQCRHVFCQKKNYEFRQGRCVKVSEPQTDTLNGTDIEVGSINITESLEASDARERNWTSCDKMIINETDFIKWPNETVYVNATQETYTKEQYDIHEDGILVCIPENYSMFMAYLSLIGLSLSSVCLLLHLLVFLVAADLNNLSDKNLASLCISLLASYICFLTVTYRRADIEEGCQFLASVMYYFLIASFVWMNVMSFDVWRALQKATSKLRVSSGDQWKKFLYYSIYAWSVPAVALTTVLVIDNTKPEYIDQSFQPGLGETQCWFQQSNSILIYFAVPLAVIMATNIVFFLLAVRTLAITAHSRATLAVTHPNQIQLKLYIKLAILMGLSWISGIVAGFIENAYVWYLFILLNAFQGFYIFIAFTCTNKIFRILYKRAETVRKISSTSNTFLAYQDNNYFNYSNASAESHYSSGKVPKSSNASLESHSTSERNSRLSTASTDSHCSSEATSKISSVSTDTLQTVIVALEEAPEVPDFH